MKIYIGVLVTYDYHRFQENVAVSFDNREILRELKAYDKAHPHRNGQPRPLYSYKALRGMEIEGETPKAYDHLWIQTLEVDTEDKAIDEYKQCKLCPKMNYE